MQGDRFSRYVHILFRRGCCEVQGLTLERRVDNRVSNVFQDVELGKSELLGISKRERPDDVQRLQTFRMNENYLRML